MSTCASRIGSLRQLCRPSRTLEKASHLGCQAFKLVCARVRRSEIAETATAANFIAQCQTNIKEAVRPHKQEEELLLLPASRTLDAFFEQCCEKLNDAG